MNATLNDVIDTLKMSKQSQDETRESIDALVSAVTAHFRMLDDRFERDRLQAEEDRRERQTRERDFPPFPHDRLPGPNPQLGPLDMLQSVFGGSFLGNFVSGLTRALLSPLRNIMKLLRVGGPVALALGALWYMLDDVGNNPKFKKTIEGIQNLWNKELVPLFDDISSMIATLVGAEGVSSTLEFIKWGWQKFSNWFVGTFKPLFQSAFLDGVIILTDTISGFIDGIRMLTKGEFVEGLKTMIGSLSSGIFNMLDNTISFILEVLGFDLGLEGSLYVAITKGVQNVIQFVKDGFSTIQEFFRETVPAWFNDMKNFVSDKFWEIIEATKQKIIDKFNELDISGRIGRTIEAIQTKFDEILKGFKDMIDYVAGIPGRVVDYIGSIIPDWLKFNTGPRIEPQLYYKPSMDQTLPIAPMDREDANEIERYLNGISSNTGEVIRRETDMTVSNRAAIPGGIMIAQDNRANNSSVTSNTAIMSFPSPMNEYIPQ